MIATDRRLLTERIRLAAFAAIGSRITTVGTQIATVPLAIALVGTEQYGAFLVLSSILGWLTLGNLGIANGLTTPLAEAFAQHDSQRVKKLIASTAVLLGTVAGGLLLLILALAPWVPWGDVLAIGNVDDLALAVIVGACLTVVGMVASLGERVLAAQQKVHVSQLLLVGSSLAILAILLLASGPLPLWILVACVFGPPVAAKATGFFVATSGLQFGRRHVDRRLGKKMLRIGLRFAVVELAAVAMWQTDNVIVAQLFDAEEVAAYATTFRLGTLASLLLAAVLPGVWPAVAAAMGRGDRVWVRTMLRRVTLVMCALSIVASILIASTGEWVIGVWTRGQLQPPAYMVWGVAAYVPVFAWCMTYSRFLNGFGLIRGQAIYGLIAAVSNATLSVVFGYQFGPVGVCWATVVSSIAPAILATWESHRHLNPKRTP